MQLHCCWNLTHVYTSLALGELLLNRQVKSYQFLSGGEVSIDNIDDAEEFKNTWVCRMLIRLIIFLVYRYKYSV